MKVGMVVDQFETSMFPFCPNYQISLDFELQNLQEKSNLNLI
jgi:hypothetical protein